MHTTWSGDSWCKEHQKPDSDQLWTGNTAKRIGAGEKKASALCRRRWRAYWSGIWSRVLWLFPTGMTNKSFLKAFPDTPFPPFSQDLCRLFPEEKEMVQITVVEAKDILSSFDHRLRAYTERLIRKRKSMNILKASVTGIPSSDLPFHPYPIHLFLLLIHLLPFPPSPHTKRWPQTVWHLMTGLCFRVGWWCGQLVLHQGTAGCAVTVL